MIAFDIVVVVTDADDYAAGAGVGVGDFFANLFCCWLRKLLTILTQNCAQNAKYGRHLNKVIMKLMW